MEALTLTRHLQATLRTDMKYVLYIDVANLQHRMSQKAVRVKIPEEILLLCRLKGVTPLEAVERKIRAFDQREGIRV